LVCWLSLTRGEIGEAPQQPQSGAVLIRSSGKFGRTEPLIISPEKGLGG